MHFSDTANHNSAIMCMDIIGTLLADKVEGLEAAKSIDSVRINIESWKITCFNSIKHY